MSSVTPSSIAMLNQLSKSSLIALIQNIQSSVPSTAPIIDSFISSSLKSSSSSHDAIDSILPYSPSSIYPSAFLSNHTAPGRALKGEETKSLLFSPKKIRSIEFKNRIIVSPMCTYSCAPSGRYAGHANDFHLVHIGKFALGGAGAVMMEASAIHPAGRISPNDLGIWSDSMIPAFKKITNFCHSQQCMAGIQLAHAGRKASTNCAWIMPIKGNLAKGNNSLILNETGEVDMGNDFNADGEFGWEQSVVGPSTIKWDDNNNWPVPHSLSIEEIKLVISLFKNAARRALSAGFDFIEIHGAHGYLISSFLSPVSNKRTDAYGGSFDNRIRLLEEVVKAVREVWPEDKPLFVRVSSTEYADEIGGWNIDDTVKLAPRLAALGVDLFDASSGGNYSKQSIPFFSSYQLPFAEAVKKNNTPNLSVGTVGLLTEAKQCEEILQQNKADFIFMAREFLRSPQWPLHAAKQLDVQIAWPQQFDRAKPAVKKSRSSPPKARL